MNDIAEIFEHKGIRWERYHYGPDGDVFQQQCHGGCDYGLLLSPARDCPTCGGSGYLAQRNDPRELEKETQR